MTTKYTFLCGINNIEVIENLRDGITISPNKDNSGYPSIRITNDKKKIVDLLERPMVISIGSIEYNYLANGYPLVAYSEGNFELDKMSSVEYLNLHLTLLKMYFFCLWMIKDNSVDFDIGFLKFKDKMGNMEVATNYMTTSNSSLKGNLLRNEFNVKELKTALIT